MTRIRISHYNTSVSHDKPCIIKLPLSSGQFFLMLSNDALMSPKHNRNIFLEQIYLKNKKELQLIVEDLEKTLEIKPSSETEKKFSIIHLGDVDCSSRNSTLTSELEIVITTESQTDVHFKLFIEQGLLYKIYFVLGAVTLCRL